MEYIQLNPFDTEPLYRQLKNSIKKAILSNRLKHDDPLPSENTLVTLFDISSTVVKAAYEVLEQEHLIVRIRGKGTFVNYPQTFFINLPFYSHLNDQIQFEYVNLTANHLPIDAPIREQMPHAKTITKIRRLIFMNQVLTTYQEIYLPNQTRDAVYRYLRKENHLKDMILALASSPKTGQWINKHGMKKATEIEASFLKIDAGSPLHKIASEIKDEHGETIGLVYTVIRGDIVALRYDKRV